MTMMSAAPDSFAQPFGGRLDMPAVSAIPRPGLLEQAMTVAVLFMSRFGTPASWFRTTETRTVESNFLLTYGSLAIVVVLMFGLIGNGDAVLRVLSAAPLLFVFLGIIGISPIWSLYFGTSLNAAVNTSVSILLAVILLVRHTWTDILRLLTITMAIGILMDLFWVVALGAYGSGRFGWTGLATQKNGLGSHGLLGIIIFLTAARTFRRFRVPLYTLAIIATVLLVGSQSKTALGAGMVSAACFVVFMAFRARKTLNGAVIMTLITGVTLSALFVMGNLEFIAGQFGKDATFTGRTPLWIESWAGVMQRPWTGHGWDGFFQGPLSPAHSITAYRPFQWNPTHSHNALLESALQVGIPATILYVVVHVQALVRATSHIRWVPGPAGLFPLVYLTTITMLSTTESGIFGMRLGLTLYVIVIVMAKIGVDEAKRARVAGPPAGPEPAQPELLRPLSS